MIKGIVLFNRLNIHLGLVKNIIDLNGKPTMAYSIEAAIQTELFEKVIVSTDSEKYADIARFWG